MKQYLIPWENLLDPKRGYHGYAMVDQVYIAWRKEKWFKNLERNFDDHAAAKLGLRYVKLDEYSSFMKEYQDLKEIVKPMTPQAREMWFIGRTPVIAAQA